MPEVRRIAHRLGEISKSKAEKAARPLAAHFWANRTRSDPSARVRAFRLSPIESARAERVCAATNDDAKRDTNRNRNPTHIVIVIVIVILILILIVIVIVIALMVIEIVITATIMITILAMHFT